MNAALDSLFDRWRDAPAPAPDCIAVLRSANHGDLPRWLDALRRIPSANASRTAFDDVVRIGDIGDLSASDCRQMEAALRQMIPWRKGPFELFGIRIDTEWRSDRKWRRIAPHVDLRGCRVLDVGCGNGYYGWRMVAAGAALVIGVEPSLLYVLQYAAVSHFAPAATAATNLVLPLPLEELTPGEPFDVVFSLGVLYHRRDPLAHLRQLAAHAGDDAVLVLETLVMEGKPLNAPRRYARMRNVHVVPDLDTLRRWLAAAGFADAEVLDVSTTTTDEQRSTAWMPFQSLAEALDRQDSTRTVEGYPAPRRAVIIASMRGRGSQASRCFMRSRAKAFDADANNDADANKVPMKRQRDGQ